MQLFGYEITKKIRDRKSEEEPETQTSFVAKQDDDGSTVVSQAGSYGQYIDVDGIISQESELITRYRMMADHPSLDIAITAIVNEAIINEPEDDTISIDLDKVESIPDGTKTKIEDEFKNVLRLYNFDLNGYEIFRRWYIDGRLFYHAIIDNNATGDGIQELRYIDPRKIRKVREVKNSPLNVKSGGGPTGGGNQVRQTAEYYIFNEKGFTKEDLSTISNQGASTGTLKISKDAIVHITSGLMDVKGKSVVSYLHKVIKPLNQLTMMEDASTIYRLSRAPERRVFYVDTSGLPRAKAEQYLKSVMNNFKNKVVYDPSSGQVRDQRKFMTMFEDFWLPRRDGGKGTEVDTLPGGQNLGEIEDIVYFQKRLYQSLGVPISRLEPEAAYSLGRASEITRDEVAFEKFITRLRARFSILILNTLRLQLLLKKIISADDWEKIKNDIAFAYAKDNLFAELKDNEVWAGRLQIAQLIQPYVGMYVSNAFVRKNIFKQTEEVQKEQDKEIQGEVGMEQFTPKVDPNDPNAQPDPGMDDLTQATGQTGQNR